jgi:CubicO group peptidase (beta-lactamase class C family)
MYLRRLPFYFLFAITVVIFNCSGDSEADGDAEEVVLKNLWTDSIFGSLSAEQQYYQHLIIEIPAHYQNKLDSLSSWIALNQPGGIKFIDWELDSINAVKEQLDTLNIIQPFIYSNYFDLLNIPKYPYWEASDKNRDFNFTKVFLKSGMSMVDFGSDVSLNTTINNWLDSLQDYQGVYPIASHYYDKNVQHEFNNFLSTIQNSKRTVLLNIELFDTAQFNDYRTSTNFEGLFLAKAESSKINGLIVQGVDLTFKSIESGDSYKSWDVNSSSSETFIESTKRILDFKSKRYRTSRRQHLEAEVKYTQLNILHNSVTLISDKSKMIPFTRRFTIYSEGNIKIPASLRKELSVSSSKEVYDRKRVKKIVEKSGNKVILLNDSTNQEVLEYLNELNEDDKTLVCFSSVGHFDQLNKTPNLLFYPSSEVFNSAIFAQQLSGRLAIGGDFVSTDSVIQGINKQKLLLARTVPEYTGLDSDTLSSINWAVNNAMRGRAFPGCQVLIAKKGCIIYDRQFGHHSYKREKVVDNESIYDLASLTKVVATTMVGMKLYEMGAYKLKDSLDLYLPDSLKDYLPYPSTIRNITFEELFIHKSGLPAGFNILGYMLYTSEAVGRFDKYYCDIADTNYCIEVADNYFLEREYEDSMWLKLNQIWLDKSKPYKYSDVNMNTLYFMFKSIIQKSPRDFGFTEPLEDLKEKDLFVEFLYRSFYDPLGMERTKYKPLRHYNKTSIVPTEDETYWRKQLLQGHVHDPNAALYGGIAGNAGMFSTTHDLAILCQMLLDKGVYNNQRYLKAETVEKFTSAQENSSRGLGFNKRTISTTGYGMADSSSLMTYGHTGFTGTCFWIDPEEDLVYIFLSNRVHPKVNNRIYQFGIRKSIHNSAYSSRMNF